jgi:hypothetical protein
MAAALVAEHDPCINFVAAVRKQRLSARAANALQDFRLSFGGPTELPKPDTVEALEQWRVQDLMRIRGIGRDSAIDIRDWMRRMGRRLSGDNRR